MGSEAWRSATVVVSFNCASSMTDTYGETTLGRTNRFKFERSVQRILEQLRLKIVVIACPRGLYSVLYIVLPTWQT